MTERTEAPTPRRIAKSREQGDIARSDRFNTCLATAVAWVALSALASPLYHSMTELLSGALALDLDQLPLQWPRYFEREALPILHHTILATLAVGAAGVLLPALVQTRGVIAFGKLRPRLDNLNPMQGLKRLFGLHKLLDVASATLQLVALAAVLGYVVIRYLRSMPPMHTLEHLPQIGQLIADAPLHLLGWMTTIMLPVALCDLMVQHRLWLRRLRMTKHDVKQEQQEDEGNPHTKGYRRALHRDLGR